MIRRNKRLHTLTIPITQNTHNDVITDMNVRLFNSIDVHCVWKLKITTWRFQVSQYYQNWSVKGPSIFWQNKRVKNLFKTSIVTVLWCRQVICWYIYIFSDIASKLYFFEVYAIMHTFLPCNYEIIPLFHL